MSDYFLHRRNASPCPVPQADFRLFHRSWHGLSIYHKDSTALPVFLFFFLFYVTALRNHALVCFSLICLFCLIIVHRPPLPAGVWRAKSLSSLVVPLVSAARPAFSSLRRCVIVGFPHICVCVLLLSVVRDPLCDITCLLWILLLLKEPCPLPPTMLSQGASVVVADMNAAEGQKTADLVNAAGGNIAISFSRMLDHSPS